MEITLLSLNNFSGGGQFGVDETSKNVDFDCIMKAFFVEFDLLFAFGVLSRRILDCASFFILSVHEHDRLGFGMLTVETAVFDWICWFILNKTETFTYLKFEIPAKNGPN